MRSSDKEAAVLKLVSRMVVISYGKYSVHNWPTQHDFSVYCLFSINASTCSIHHVPTVFEKIIFCPVDKTYLIVF